MSEQRLTIGQYRNAAKVFYDHSAGCSPRQQTIDELAAILQYPIIPSVDAPKEAVADMTNAELLNEYASEVTSSDRWVVPSDPPSREHEFETEILRRMS